MSFHIVSIISLVVIFTSCSKKDAGSPGQPLPDTTAATSNVLGIYDVGEYAVNTLLQYGKAHNTDPITTLYAIVDSIKQMDGVASAGIEDSIHLVISMKNGMQTMLALDFRNSNGTSVTRGGTGNNYNVDGLTTEEVKRILIKNKRILFYSPPFQQFYVDESTGEDKRLEEIATKSGKDVTFERATGYFLKPSVVNTFKDYGLVIMSTHGFRFGYMCGALNIPDFYKPVKQPDGTVSLKRAPVNNEAQLKKLIVANNEQGVYESLINKELMAMFAITIEQPYSEWVEKVNKAVGDSKNYYAQLIVTTKYLNHVNSFDSTVIFGNMCYSGAHNNGVPFISDGPSGGFMAIRDAMMNKNPGAYYCYVAQEAGGLPISNEDAVNSEQSLLRSLVREMDTTGNAHRTNEGKSITARAGDGPEKRTSELSLFGKDNIWYGCGGTGQLTDARDGNVYKTVCVNGREWMAENLRYNAQGSVVYNHDPAMAAKYGRLYSWPQLMNGQAPSDAVPSGVQGICPKGWHIPSAAEFDAVITALGGLDVAGGKMKATTDWQTPGYGSNQSGLNVLPGGDYNPGVNFGFGETLGRTAHFRSSSAMSNGAVWTYSFDDTRVSIRKTNYSPNSSYGDPWFYGCRCAKD